MAKQKPRKKSRRKTKKNSSLLKILIIFLSLLSITPIAIGYYLYSTGKLTFNFNEGQKSKIHKTQQAPVADKELIEKMEKVLKKSKSQIQTQKLQTKQEQNSTKKEQNKTALKKDMKKKQEVEQKTEKPMFPTISDALANQKPTEIEDYIQSTKKSPPTKKKKVIKRNYKGLPKLAIIIDDVSFEAQVKKIKKIPYKVTSSFLPPTKKHPNTPKLARKFAQYMVHLPLEAYRHSHPEEKTLKKGESYKNIEAWIREIKKDFPKAKYYNNHTGSKFTADTRSMDKLFRALKNHNLLFLDSRTTVNTKAKAIAIKYNMPLFSRDVFLDNSYKEQDIKKQLLEAVRIAKLQGFAIAICHPHSATLKVLRNAKPLLKGVKLVHVNEL